jgi:hypothetical protein
MSPTYKQNKKFIMNWRAKNYDRQLAINRKSKMKMYFWKKIQRIYLNILIPDDI